MNNKNNSLYLAFYHKLNIMSEVHGIEKLKVLAMWGIALAEDLEKTFEDGKFKLVEAFRFVDNFNDLENILPYVEDIKNEFLDLSENERGELENLVKDELGIEESKAIDLVSAGLGIAFSVGAAINVIRA